MPPLKAFIVEDNPVIRQNLIATLEETAWMAVVGCSDNEAEAIDWLNDPANQCDIAIIDIFLRRGSGLGVLRALQRAGSVIQRVVLTNHATEAMRSQCTALAANQVFDKSEQIEDLLDCCAQLAQQRAAATAAPPNPPAATGSGHS